MVKWRRAAYIGLVVFPTFVLAPGCGEPSEPPPGTSEDDVEEVELDLGTEIDAPSAEPGEPSDSNDDSEPEGDAQSSESGE